MSNSSRRDFLVRLGIGGGAAALCAQGAVALRSLVPNVSYDAPTTVKLGLPDEFPEGLKYLPDERSEPMSSAQTAPEPAPAAEALKRSPDRRDFLIKVGIGAGTAALVAQAAASLRSLVPNVSYDAPTTVKLGPPNDFPDGMKFIPEQRLFVFREGKTFHAISAVCTHLGCTVRAEALQQPQQIDVKGKPLQLTHQFLCPCHGSRYHGDGTNYAGPAPKPLAWYELSLAADDGQVVVDLAKPVDHLFRLKIG